MTFWKIFFKLFLFFFLLPTTGWTTCIGLNCTCTIASNTFNFGNYLPLSGSSVSNTGTISVTCSALIVGLQVAYTISMNTGSSGSFSARTMSSSPFNLQYNLYTDLAHTLIWGDGSSSTHTVSDAYNLAVMSMTRNYTVYGLIPASQNVGPGSYSDSITATVTF